MEEERHQQAQGEQGSDGHTSGETSAEGESGAAVADAGADARGPVDPVRSADVFADGMVEMLLPIVEETDARVQAVFAAQAELQENIQRLGAELERFVETTHSPALTPYVQKISQAKARMERSQQVVQTIKTRIAKLERQYAR